MFFVAAGSAFVVAAPLVHSRYKMASESGSSGTGSSSSCTAAAPPSAGAPIVRRPSVAPSMVPSVEERAPTDDAAEEGSWWYPSTLLSYLPGQTTYASVKNMVDTKRSMGWLYDEMNYVLGEMEDTPEEYKMPLQEFSWGDIFSSVTKASELGSVMSSMPTFFWIFVITLIWQFVYLADIVMHLWIDLLLSYYGWISYVILFAVSCVSWPEFIIYVKQATRHGETKLEKHQRTIQLHGMPAKYCEDDSMNTFLGERQIIDGVKLVTISEQENPMVEVVFENSQKLKEAFNKDVNKDALSKSITVDGQEVRVRLKVGVNTAAVAYYEYCFTYLYENVPERYWFRAVLSCLVTMSLASRLLAEVPAFLGRVVSAFGWVGDAFGFVCASASLVFLGFYAGYHAYFDMHDAKNEINQEPHEDTGVADDQPQQPTFQRGKSEDENSKDKDS